VLPKIIKSTRLIILVTLISLGANAQQIVEGEVIVKLKGNPNAGKSNAFLGKALGKMQLKATFGRLGMHHMKAKQGQKIEDLLQELRNDPNVEYAEPNYIIKMIAPTSSEARPEKLSVEEGEKYFAQSSSSDSYTQSDNTQVKVTEAWGQMNENPQGVPIVAVIDTGFDYSHSVFTQKNAVWENPAEVNGLAHVDDDGNGYVDDFRGWNFVNGNNNPMDSDASDIKSHGTHVAGIILGVTQPLDSVQQARIKIMGLKFLGEGGTGSTSGAIQAIYYAVNNGAKVINMSWGGSTYSQSLHDALAYAYDHQVFLAAAAGNSTENNDTISMYPANLPVPSQITVAAVTDFDNLASFSNFGLTRVQMAAPGVGIYSTAVGGYRFMSGTSMASPFVAGLGALVLSERSDFSGYQVRNLLLNASDSVSQLVNKIQQGYRAQALSSLLSAQGQLGIQAAAQPGYVPNKPAGERAPASEQAQMGGCGLVSSSIMNQWRQNPSGPSTGSAQNWLLFAGFSLLPLMVWQALRMKSLYVDPQSRRRHERFVMNSEIKVKLGDRELTGHMSTISMGGLSFKADTLLEQGGLVTLQISSPNGQEQIEVEGRIVWSEENKAYGVQFANEKSEIGSWSKHLSKAS